MENVKQYFWPCVIAFAVGVAVGTYSMPNLFNYVSSEDAEERAEVAVEDALLAIYVPQCVENAQADPDGLAAMLEKRTYQRRDAFAEAGWVVYPPGVDSDSKQRVFNQGCLDELE